MTLKQRIENHRNHAACMSCHAKIDPWGIPFENFDAVGSWRDAIDNHPVDASSQLFNKQQLDGMDDSSVTCSPIDRINSPVRWSTSWLRLPSAGH